MAFDNEKNKVDIKVKNNVNLRAKKTPVKKTLPKKIEKVKEKIVEDKKVEKKAEDNSQALAMQLLMDNLNRLQNEINRLKDEKKAVPEQDKVEKTFSVSEQERKISAYAIETKRAKKLSNVLGKIQKKYYRDASLAHRYFREGKAQGKREADIEREILNKLNLKRFPNNALKKYGNSSVSWNFGGLKVTFITGDRKIRYTWIYADHYNYLMNVVNLSHEDYDRKGRATMSPMVANKFNINDAEQNLLYEKIFKDV